jgi:hypothetical protein
LASSYCCIIGVLAIAGHGTSQNSTGREGERTREGKNLRHFAFALSLSCIVHAEKCGLEAVA